MWLVATVLDTAAVNHNPMQQNGLKSGLTDPAIQSSNILIIDTVGVKLTPDDDNTCRESLGTKQAFFFQYATMTRLKTMRTPMLAKVEPKIVPSCPEMKN